jgi:hypothetical protein
LLLRSSWVQITDASKGDKSVEKRFTVNLKATIHQCALLSPLTSAIGDQGIAPKMAGTVAVLCFDQDHEGFSNDH